MFPLKQRKLVHGVSWHLKNKEGAACDYFAVYEQLFAPFDGVLSNPYPWTFDRGTGGMWLRFTRLNGDYIEFAHLSKRIKKGTVKQGDLIATTGNTGQWTYGPHLHIQIFVNGKRVDPDKYAWDTVDNTEQMVKDMFTRIWGVPPATGDWKYFVIRLKNGSLKPKNLESTIAFWHTKPDSVWQIEKQSYLNGRI